MWWSYRLFHNLSFWCHRLKSVSTIPKVFADVNLSKKKKNTWKCNYLKFWKIKCLMGVTWCSKSSVIVSQTIQIVLITLSNGSFKNNVEIGETVVCNQDFLLFLLCFLYPSQIKHRLLRHVYDLSLHITWIWKSPTFYSWVKKSDFQKQFLWPAGRNLLKTIWK